VLWLLVLGAFINVIIAWIYDITPGGMRRTKPMEEVTPEERIPDSRGWKAATYISLVVIVALVILNLVPPKTLRAGDIQSLLILPFDNFTGDDQLDYVAAGMHSALIGDMGQISALRVISKTTASVYKTKDMSLPQIANEINMGAVVEPSVMCYGDSVCIQIRVITMYPEEKQLWVAEYKEEKSQILNLYSKITKEIANDLMVELTPREERLFARSRTVDRGVYDAYLRSQQYLDDLSLESLNEAREYLNIAIEKDPDWVPLYSSLAMVWMSLAQNSFESPSVAYQKAYEYIEKALKLDPDHADTHFIIAHTAWLNEWDWTKAEKEFLKAMATNPNDVWTRMWYAHLLGCLQRHDEALTQAQLASDLDPLNPFVQTMFSVVLTNAGDCEAGMVVLEKVLAIEPENFMANVILFMIAYRCGNYDKVMVGEKHILKVYSRGELEEDDFKEIERIYDEQGFPAIYEEELRLWEVLANKGFVGPIDMAIVYMKGNKQDKAMDLIEKAYEIRDPNMPYIATHTFLCEPLFDNPRFIEILQKMHLPLPEE